MRSHYEQQSKGLAINISKGYFGKMISNDAYNNSRLEIAGGKLVLFKQFTESIVVAGSGSSSGEMTNSIIAEFDYDYKENHWYRMVFQCRSLTAQPDGTLGELYVGFNTLGGGSTGSDGQIYSSGFGYGPIRFDLSAWSDSDQTVTTRLLYVMVNADFDIHLDSSEGAYAYFALYDEGVKENGI